MTEMPQSMTENKPASGALLYNIFINSFVDTSVHLCLAVSSPESDDAYTLICYICLQHMVATDEQVCMVGNHLDSHLISMFLLEHQQ